MPPKVRTVLNTRFISQHFQGLKCVLNKFPNINRQLSSRAPHLKVIVIVMLRYITK